MKFNSPKYHSLVVGDLMNGKFILSKDQHFDTIIENKDYYESFFNSSFGHELIVQQNYCYLLSDETNENLSRDISIFIAILCYELDKDGRNFLDQFEYGDFSFEEVDSIFDNSSFSDLIGSNNHIKDSEARRKLIKTMASKNIIDRTDTERFSFTPAYNVFFDFARDLADRKIQETEIDTDK